MTRLVLEQVTDFGDYTGGKELSELLKQQSGGGVGGVGGECSRTRPLSDVRVSPDGRHIHVILRRPRVGLVTFDKYERPQLIRGGGGSGSHHRLDLGGPGTRTVPIVDLVYLSRNNNNSGVVVKSSRDQQQGDSSAAAAATLVVVFENGKAEFWRFQECRAGWHFLQTAELCNSPRAKVVSVSACSDHIVWCEERPPSESSTGATTTATTSATRNNFRYCICKRAFEVVEGAVTLGGVKIALHNNPRFSVVSSGERAVYLLPDQQDKRLLSVSKLFLVWFPQHDSFRVSSTCRGTLLNNKRDSPNSVRESDFKRLVADSLGYLSALDPPEICCCSPVSARGGGGLLLLLSSGWVSLLQRDGTLRRVYKLADNCTPASRGGTHCGLRAYRDTLALTVGRTLYLVDLACGRELQKISLKREGLLYEDGTDVPQQELPRLLSETGLFAVMQRDTDPPRPPRASPPPLCDAPEGLALRPPGAHLMPEAESLLRPGALLLEAVFEEACKYYQQRSLSSTQLTVDKLKKGGMFQAPISLASIVRDYLGGEGGLKGAAGLSSQQGGGRGGTGPGEKGPDKLLGSLEAELKALVSLEEVKGSLVRGGQKEVEAVRDSLVEQEVTRLLSSGGELDREAVLHLNSIFGLFSCQAWSAAKAALQLRCNGEDTLSSWAPQDVWKTILSPVPAPSSSSSSASAGLPYANGQPKQHKLGHRASGPVPKPNLPGSGSNFPAAANSAAALPVFELLCHSIFHFQPSWLPRFLELAQQQQGSAGLGLSLASSSWGYPGGGRAGEQGQGSSLPLYKRALAVLPHRDHQVLPGGPHRDHQVLPWPGGPHRDPQVQDLEVELLLVSGRPNAILQALRILMGRQQWERVTQVAQRFCAQSPLLNKEIFTVLLCEVAQHRDLDPYLELLWTLCPEDVTVTAILNLVLKNIPSHTSPPPPAGSSSSSSSSLLSSPSPPPFAHAGPGDPQRGHLTVGLLKPLLRRVLQRETKPSQRYADILQSPSFPAAAASPPAVPAAPAPLPRQAAGVAPQGPGGGGAGTGPALQGHHRMAAEPHSPAQECSKRTAVQAGRVTVPINPV